MESIERTPKETSLEWRPGLMLGLNLALDNASNALLVVVTISPAKTANRPPNMLRRLELLIQIRMHQCQEVFEAVKESLIGLVIRNSTSKWLTQGVEKPVTHWRKVALHLGKQSGDIALQHRSWIYAQCQRYRVAFVRLLYLGNSEQRSEGLIPTPS